MNIKRMIADNQACVEACDSEIKELIAIKDATEDGENLDQEIKMLLDLRMMLKGDISIDLRELYKLYTSVEQ